MTACRCQPRLRSRRLSGAAALLVAAGCAVSADPFPPDYTPVGSSEGELVVEVTFSGVVGCAAAGVDQVRLTFPDKEQSPQDLSCAAGGAAFELSLLTTGPHVLTLDGFRKGTVVFSATTTVTVVPGPQRITLNLNPVSAALPVVTAPLTIDVEFAGQTTCSVAGVDTVRLSFPNGDAPTQTVSCGTAAVQLAVPALAVGIHALTVDGLARGTVIFTLTKDLTLAAGGTTVTMDLAAVGSNEPASILARFIFGAEMTTDPAPVGMTCLQAGVQSVSVTIDSGHPLTVSCHDPSSASDSATVPVMPGIHTLEWEGFASVDASGAALYSATLAAVMVPSAPEQPMVVNMTGLVNGGFALDWSLGAVTCAQAGAATVTYSVADALGNVLPGMPVTAACSMRGFAYSVSPGLTPGVYVLVSIQADDADGNELFHDADFRLYAPAAGQPTFVDTLSAG